MLLIWRKRKEGSRAGHILIGAIPSEHKNYVLADLALSIDSSIGFQQVDLGDYHEDGLFNESGIDWEDPVR